MIDGEWQLDYVGTTLKWGMGSTTDQYSIYNTTYPDLGDTSITEEDSERPRKDGVAFGTDYFGGRTITFGLGVAAPTELLALQAQSAIIKAWHADEIRSSPGAVATLTTQNAGRQRLTYGRPRRMATVHSIKRKSGIVELQCDFKCADHLFYDVGDQAITVPFVPTPTTGFTVPFSVPWSTAGASTVNWTTMIVNSEKPVWPVITIKGPIINPVVKIAPQGGGPLLLPLSSSQLASSWALKLNMTIGAGGEVTIDTRPWRQSVTRSDGASFAGYLSRDSRIDQASIYPGTYSIILGGIDPTGTSKLTIRWRNAYASI
jgi:hypothetical protein